MSWQGIVVQGMCPMRLSRHGQPSCIGAEPVLGYCGCDAVCRALCTTVLYIRLICCTYLLRTCAQLMLKTYFSCFMLFDLRHSFMSHEDMTHRWDYRLLYPSDLPSAPESPVPSPRSRVRRVRRGPWRRRRDPR